jgi:hypothetical protein
VSSPGQVAVELPRDRPSGSGRSAANALLETALARRIARVTHNLPLNLLPNLFVNRTNGVLLRQAGRRGGFCRALWWEAVVGVTATRARCLARRKVQNVSSGRRTGPRDGQRYSLRFGLKVTHSRHKLRRTVAAPQFACIFHFQRRDRWQREFHRSRWCLALIFPLAKPTTRTRSPCATNSRGSVSEISMVSDCVFTSPPALRVRGAFRPAASPRPG